MIYSYHLSPTESRQWRANESLKSGPARATIRLYANHQAGLIGADTIDIIAADGEELDRISYNKDLKLAKRSETVEA